MALMQHPIGIHGHGRDWVISEGGAGVGRLGDISPTYTNVDIWTVLIKRGFSYAWIQGRAIA
jgi:hypothetical protein